MSKSPAFQFYVQDFLLGTMHFSAEEVGAYVRLLCYQWDNGFIENDDSKIKKISGISKKKIEKVLEKFSLGRDGLYKNNRLEKERRKQIDLRKRRSDAGKKGNQIKYKGRKAIANQSQSDRKNIAFQSSSSTSVNTTTKVVVEADPFFEMFRRCAGTHISDDELILEIAKFKNRYPNHHPNQAGALINAWVANIGRKAFPAASADEKKSKILV